MKLCAGIFTASIAMAQLSAPNSSGVAMGHLHYKVQNVEANKKFWVALGSLFPDLHAGAMVYADSHARTRPAA